jgi:hypothetical protein
MNSIISRFLPWPQAILLCHLSITLLALPAANAAPISPDNVVVFRAGSGANPLGNTGNNVFLDEYTTAGSLVQSIEINSTGTGTKLVVAGNLTAEGGLTISPDGKWIAFAGYNSGAGAASSLSAQTSSTLPRVAGVLNTTTGSYSLTVMGTMFSGVSPRSAVSTDGNKIFASGGGNGLVYGTADGNTAFESISGTLATNLRWLGAYGTSASGTSLFVSAATGTWPTVGVYGGTPLVSGTATSLTAQPGIPLQGGTPITSRYGFVYLDTNPSIPGLDTMYVADDGLSDGGITKYLLDASSGTWNKSGQLSGSRVNPTSNFRGLTGSFDGTNVTLFGTVLSSSASAGGTSQLFRLVDSGAATSTLSGTTSDLTILATSGTNQVFRGVVYVTGAAAPVAPSVNSWPTASAITYGQTLASSNLSGGSASAAGNFTFTSPSTAPAVGTALQSVTFTPTDAVKYTTVSGNVSVTVNKLTPEVTVWPSATAIDYGQTLASSILSGGAASVAGTFAFTNPSTAPAAGTASQAVTFTPTDGVNYATVNGTVSVTVNVVRTHQELWRFANFGSYASDASAADSADPDGDGLSNLIEYALGTGPNSSGVMPASLALNGANLEYTYTRSTAAKDNGVTYQIEWGDTLQAVNWSTETVNQQITSTQGALETVKASVPKGNGGKRFLRLRVSAPVGDQ